MKQQFAELWADAVVWMKAHLAITTLSIAVVIISIVAILR